MTRAFQQGELDKLSYKYEEYLQDEDYEERCKGRCKANLKKLCGENKNGAITFIREIKVEKSIRLMKYKINLDDISNVENPVPKSAKMTKKNNVNGLSGCEAVQGDKVYSEDKHKIETLPNEQSHYLCLSNFNPIVYVLMPVGASISSAGASPINCAESQNSDFQSDGKLTFSNGNNHVQAMDTRNVATTQYTPSGYNGLKYSNNPLNGFQAGVSPTNCAESLNSDFQSDGKLTFSNGNNHVQASDTRNVATTQYTLSGYNGFKCSNNPPNGFQAGAPPTNCAEGRNSDFQSDGKLTSSNGNNHVEVVDTRNVATTQFIPSGHNGLNYHNNPPNGFQAGASPTSCAESLNSDFQSDGKLISSNGNNHVEAMDTRNVATTQYTPSGYNGLTYSNNPLNGFQAGASPTNCAEDLNFDFQSDGKLTFSNCNNHVEAMGTRNVATTKYTLSGYNGLKYSNNLPNGFQAGASPTNCAESLNSDFQSDGKLTSSNGNNHVGAMDTRNVATMQYTPSGHNGLNYHNNPPNGFQAGASPTNCAESLNSDFQSDGKLAFANFNNPVAAMDTQNNEGLQDSNVESKNCAQMVPGSPLEYNVISNDPSSEWDMDDISKPLQGDYDPLLSSTILDPSSNYLFEGNGCLPLDTEARPFMSFEY
ncbi:hypothetical protein AVEN_99324-2 [Araneus ventricosus]|uniref:Uncharacterized protein n=1 Tax=Araneus ventricosus TaxID=182803 RepID=A0A4Y2PEJ0_ARAVE|nr:hypothetical protein AVEN_99324-2 [Araneus ventricosus]